MAHRRGRKDNMKKTEKTLLGAVAPRVFMKYPTALLAACATLLFYVFAVHYLSAAYAGEAAGGIVSPENTAEASLLRLRRKIDIYKMRGAENSRLLTLAKASGVSPFCEAPTVSGGEIYIAEASPPVVLVSAVAINGAVKIALIDVDDKNGLQVQENSLFCDGAGRVLRINREGVEWSWGSNVFRSSLRE